MSSSAVPDAVVPGVAPAQSSFPQGKLKANPKGRDRVGFLAASGEVQFALADAYNRAAHLMPPVTYFTRVKTWEEEDVAGDDDDDGIVDDDGKAVPDRKRMMQVRVGDDATARTMRLSYADFIFFDTDTGEPLVLVERKTLPDMSSSIMSKHFLKQWFRMLATGIRPAQTILLLEADSMHEMLQDTDVANMLFNYITKLQICDGLSVVLVTRGDLPLWLHKMYRFLNRDKRFELGSDGKPQIRYPSQRQHDHINACLDVLEKSDSLESIWEDDGPAQALSTAMSFLPAELRGEEGEGRDGVGFARPSPVRQKEFLDSRSYLDTLVTKHGVVSNEMMMAMFLMQLQGITSAKAHKLAELWPNPDMMCRAYELLVSERQRENMVKDVLPGSGMGAVISKTIYHVFVGETMRKMLMARDMKRKTATADGRKVLTAYSKKEHERALKHAKDISVVYELHNRKTHPGDVATFVRRLDTLRTFVDGETAAAAGPSGGNDRDASPCSSVESPVVESDADYVAKRAASKRKASPFEAENCSPDRSPPSSVSSSSHQGVASVLAEFEEHDRAVSMTMSTVGSRKRRMDEAVKKALEMASKKTLKKNKKKAKVGRQPQLSSGSGSDTHN